MPAVVGRLVLSVAAHVRVAQCLAPATQGPLGPEPGPVRRPVRAQSVQSGLVAVPQPDGRLGGCRVAPVLDEP